MKSHTRCADKQPGKMSALLSIGRGAGHGTDKGANERRAKEFAGHRSLCPGIPISATSTCCLLVRERLSCQSTGRYFRSSGSRYRFRLANGLGARGIDGGYATMIIRGDLAGLGKRNWLRLKKTLVRAPRLITSTKALILWT